MRWRPDILVIAALALAAAAASAAADGIGLPLGRVHLVSDAWIDDEGLRQLLPLTPGEPVTQQRLAESRRALESTDLFTDIAVTTRAKDGRAVVIFTLTRKRVITDVSVTGYDHLTWRDVYRSLRLLSGAFYDAATLEAAEQRLLRRYEQEGFPHAEVRSALAERPGAVDITVTIDEGEPVEIAAVVVTGDTGLPSDELESAVEDLVGKPHGRKLGRDGERLLLKELRRAGYYDAEIESEFVPSDASSGVLRFTVNAGERTDVEIIGNESCDREHLLGLMELETRLIITDGTWRELARRMARDYQQRGYYRAAVEVDIQPGTPRHVVFRVAEGRKYTLRELRFVGNRQMSADALRKHMNTRARGWLPWPRSGVFFRPAFDEDLRRLWYFYREEGFADAEIVDAPVEVDDATGDIAVTVVIAEGPRTIVEALRPPDFSVLPATVPTPELKLVPGQPLRPAILDADTKAIAHAFRRGGHRDVSVEPAVTRRLEGEIAPAVVAWTVVPGPRYTIGDVVVRRNVETRNDVVRRQLPFESGDPLDPELLQHGQDEVYALGIYRSVSVEPIEPGAAAEGASVTVEPGESRAREAEPATIVPEPAEPGGEAREEAPVTIEPKGARGRPALPGAAADQRTRAGTTRDIAVEVLPRPPGRLQWGGGYNTRDGITGFGELSYDNLGHRARRLTLRGQGSVVPDDPGSTQFNVALAYRQPQFFDLPWQWTSELAGQRSTRTIDQFDIERASLGSSLLRSVLPRLEFGPQLQIEYAHVFNVQPLPFRGEDEGSSYTTKAGASLIYDGRDDPFAPRRGVFDSLRLDYAPPGISSVQFGKLNMQHSQAIPLSEWLSFVYTTRISYGGVVSGATVLPIRERYFLGGSTTVRGFDENSLGPVDANGTVIGGDLAMVLSLEWRVPIIYQLSAAVFNDNGALFLTQCGSSCRTQRDVHNNAFTFQNFRHSAGPGLRYMTPVGPISLDYGFKLDRRSGESIGEVHFSISGTF